jgi:membrane protease subunit HflC
MNRAYAPALVVIAVVIIAIFSGVFYQVNEREQVIITQFGRPVRGPITEPGLKMKLPFVQTVRRFDKRVLEWDGTADQIPTLDKRFILLDTTARWRIVDPLLFLQAAGNERSAQSRLDDIIESSARDVVSSHDLIQVVRNFQRYLEVPRHSQGDADAPSQQTAPASDAAPKEGTTEGTTEQGSTEAAPVPVQSDAELEERLGRQNLSLQMAKRAREILPNLGIELVDVNIKRINYVREVEERVYERMISERKRIAAQFRSEGDGASARIRGEMERELDRIQSEAYRKAQEIIGQGDAEAARIYAESYGANPDFYSFVQTLETYKQTMQGNANLLLTTESDFYRYLKGDGQNSGTPASSAPRTSDSGTSGAVN